MQWDIILSINNILPENSEEFIDIIQKNINTEVSLSIQRDNTIISLPVIPNEEWKIGSYISPNIIRNTDFIYKYWAFASLKYGFLETYYQSRLTLQWLWMLIKNIFTPETPEDRTLALDQVAGPIGIVWIITQSLEWGFVLLIILWALISVNLWVFNLLPIPALDGGRILLLWIRSSVELVIGKNALSGKIENFIHIFFFMLLIALSILIAYNDIIKLIFQ
jgi:regulator of sigma E protease